MVRCCCRFLGRVAPAPAIAAVCSILSFVAFRCGCTHGAAHSGNGAHRQATIVPQRTAPSAPAVLPLVHVEDDRCVCCVSVCVCIRSRCLRPAAAMLDCRQRNRTVKSPLCVQNCLRCSPAMAWGCELPPAPRVTAMLPTPVGARSQVHTLHCVPWSLPPLLLCLVFVPSPRLAMHPWRSALGLAPACCERRLERNHQHMMMQAGTVCFMNISNAAWPVRRSRKA
jgi:hypothetical protein